MEKKAKSWWYNPADEYKQKAAEDNSKKAADAVNKRVDEELGDWSPSAPDAQTKESIGMSATSSGDSSSFNKKAQQFIYKHLNKWVNMNDRKAVIAALEEINRNANVVTDDGRTVATDEKTDKESRALLDALAPKRKNPFGSHSFNASNMSQADWNSWLSKEGTVGVHEAAWKGSKNDASKMQNLVIALANNTTLQTPLNQMSQSDLQSALIQAYHMLNTYGGKKLDSAREQISNALYDVMDAGANLENNLDYHEMILRIAKSADAGGGAYINESRYKTIEDYIAEMKPQLEHSNKGAATSASSLSDPAYPQINEAVKVLSNYTDGIVPMEKSARKAYDNAQKTLKKHFPKSGNPYQDATSWLNRQNAAKAANEQGGQNGRQ